MNNRSQTAMAIGKIWSHSGRNYKGVIEMLQNKNLATTVSVQDLLSTKNDLWVTKLIFSQRGQGRWLVSMLGLFSTYYLRLCYFIVHARKRSNCIHRSFFTWQMTCTCIGEEVSSSTPVSLIPRFHPSVYITSSITHRDWFWDWEPGLHYTLWTTALASFPGSPLAPTT